MPEIEDDPEDATTTEISDDEVGKPIYTAEGNRVGTVGDVHYPTLYVDVADDIDPELLSDMKVSKTTARRSEKDGDVLAGIPIGAIETVTEDEVVFWPSYASESPHESVDYEEIPQEDAHGEFDS